MLIKLTTRKEQQLGDDTESLLQVVPPLLGLNINPRPNPITKSRHCQTPHDVLVKPRWHIVGVVEAVRLGDLVLAALDHRYSHDRVGVGEH